MKKQTAGKLEKSVSENGPICIGAARARRASIDAKEWIADLPLGNDRYFIMDRLVSDERVVSWFRVYKGTRSLNGCETYAQGMEIQPDTPYKLPDTLNRIIYEE